MSMTIKDRLTRQDRLNVERLQAWRKRYRDATGHWPDVLWHAWQRSVGLEFPLLAGRWPSLRVLGAAMVQKHRRDWAQAHKLRQLKYPY